MRNSDFEGSPHTGEVAVHGESFTGIGVGVFMLPDAKGPGASVLVENCVIQDNEQFGIAIHNKGNGFGPLVFRNCRLEGNGSKGAAIYVGALPFEPLDSGGDIRFENVTITPPKGDTAPPMLTLDTRVAPITGITGTIRTMHPEIRRVGGHPTEGIDLKVRP